MANAYSDTPKEVGENIKNILSEEQLLEMEKNGTVPPNEEFFTPEDDFDRDKVMILNWIYPVGTIYKAKNSYGVNPNTWGVGTWEKLAENVIMPLGDYVDVDTLRDAHAISGLGLKVNVKKAQNLGIDTSGMFYSTDGLPPGSGYNNPVFTNLYAKLSTATNAISGVDVWLRTS